MPPDKISECSVEKCDIFDFMAQYVGLSVLHPGGFKATERLAEECKISKQTRVLDIACGKGTSAVFLAQKYGCQVEGLDISEDLIEEAQTFAKRKGVNDRVKFRVGDALDLTYPENEFDAAISQAMLILVSDKRKAVQEARRVLKTGGNAGWLELSWKKYPPEEFISAVSSEICAYCMTNVLTFEDWERLFLDAEFSQVKVIRSSMAVSGIKGMLQDEGFGNVVKVMGKYLFNVRVRKRMMNLNKFINSNPQYFGYGIYITKK
jgi:ubiquinone/menaquinone biosynthesis C-methylase UbiE